MIQLTTLGNLTCYSIIIAMAIIVFKAFSHPISNFLKAINPFFIYKKIRNIEERLNEIETLYNYEFKNEILDIKKRLNKK
jgi:hypothetical protein